MLAMAFSVPSPSHAAQMSSLPELVAVAQQGRAERCQKFEDRISIRSGGNHVSVRVAVGAGRFQGTNLKGESRSSRNKLESSW